MNRTPAHRNPRVGGSTQRGLGLIEVLVAVLILSIGLLGVGLVQLRTLSGNNSSMARSMAVVASYSILESMRADRANALAAAYNDTVTAGDCPDAGTLAETQLHNWCLELAASLGDNEATSGTVNCNAGGACTISIQFDDSRIGAGGNAAQRVVTQAQL